MINALLLIIFCLCFSVLAWRKTLWGVLIISALLPLYLIRFHIAFLPMTLLEAMILILFLIWLFKNKFSRHKVGISASLRQDKVWLALIIAWLIAATISVFTAPDLETALGLWKAYFIEPILFLIVFVDTIKTKKDLYKVFMALGISAIYIGALAVYQKFTGYLIPNAEWYAPETRRITGVYGFPNAVGLYFAPLAVLFFGLAIKNIKKVLIFIFYAVAFILSCLGITFAVSEGAIVGVVAGIFFFLLINKKTRIPAIVLAIILIIALQFNVPLKDKVAEKLTLQDFSGKLRLEMWGETFEMLKESPIWGAGLGGYQEAVAPFHNKDYIEIYLYPHNKFLNFWSELGIFGLIIFFLILIKFFYDGFITKQNKFLAIILMSAMAAMLIHGLVDVPYFKNDLAVLFWLIVGSCKNFVIMS